MNSYHPGPRNHRFLGSRRPRGPQKPVQKAGREAPRLLERFLGPPGPSSSLTAMISGSLMIGFHDYINTKLVLVSLVSSTGTSFEGPALARPREDLQADTLDEDFLNVLRRARALVAHGEQQCVSVRVGF